MIKVYCMLCKSELKKPGAILLSPPDKEDRVVKRHLCDKCYKEWDSLLEKVGFLKHLDFCSKTVASWPEWKRNALKLGKNIGEILK